MNRVIQFALQQKVLVLLASMVLLVGGWLALNKINIDAIPDLSDVQVIVKVSYPGQSPQTIEQQVTWPLSNRFLAVPKVTDVRGYSFFGDAYLYLIFEDGTDLYWARSRVLEYLSQASAALPDGTNVQLGPDASGVGWVYQYALVDKSGNQHLADLKALQDWYLKPSLQSVAGVAEVATVGGMTRTYQVVINPLKLKAYQLGIEQVRQAIVNANGETGGGIIEQAEAEFMVRSSGYLQSPEDFRQIPVGPISQNGSPVTLADVATLRLGPQMRRGIAELDGLGEVVGGIVVMRQGENARSVIAAVKQQLEQLKAGLPDTVELVTTYDRSGFIQAAVDNLKTKLWEEMGFVALVIILFLLHVRSALVVIIVLPMSLLGGVVLLWALDITANIMSLGGIAIAIGALVDAAIVMLENLHKHLHEFQQKQQRPASKTEHFDIVLQSAQQVGPTLFWSLMLITVSFFPVFALQGQEGKLFIPLAVAKSLVMAVAAMLAVTLVPVLMSLLVKGKLVAEDKHPLSRLLMSVYRPALRLALAFPRVTLLLGLMASLSLLYPLSRLGSEFMPTIAEGDLLYMPTTLPGISPAAAAKLLQQTDRLIATQPEVERVFGKVGRADTATDPAPLTMLETTIMLKPKAQWREGMTLADIIAELDQRVNIPGLTNAWVQPVKTRIDMLSTGLKTPLGIKISGDDPEQISQIGQQVERLLNDLPQTRSVLAERVSQGRYIDIQPNRQQLARYGLTVAELNRVIRYAIGGDTVDQVVQGTQRFPINIRLPRDWRDSIDRLADIPLVTSHGKTVLLGQVASLNILDGPAMLKSENSRLVGWVFVEVEGVSLGEYIDIATPILDQGLALPPRYNVSWTGQYESMQRLQARLQIVIPATVMLCALLLYLTLKHWAEVGMILVTLPAALAGSLWMLWWWDFNLSVAVFVGMIALAGVAIEFGVVMLLYLKQSWHPNQTHQATQQQLHQAVMDGAIQRIRPKAMTVMTIVASLYPLLGGQGTGHEVMQRIAAPMLGGMVVAPLISLFVVPVLFYLFQLSRLKTHAST